MTHSTRSLIILAAGFLIAVLVVFYMNLQIAAASDGSFLLYNLSSLACLITVFGLFLFLFAKNSDIAQKKQSQLQHKIETTTDSLNDAQSQGMHLSNLGIAIPPTEFTQSIATLKLAFLIALMSTISRLNIC